MNEEKLFLRKSANYYGRMYAKQKGLFILPKAYTREETVDRLIKGDSIARFGDGEFRFLFRKGIFFQEFNVELANRLKEVLTSSKEHLLIGIPTQLTNDLSIYKDFAADYWGWYRRKNRVGLSRVLDKNRIYYASDITRFYMDFKDKSGCEEYIEKMKLIWKDRDIVFVEGEKSRAGVGNDLFDGAKSISRILCPPENSYSKYNEILHEVTKFSKDKLILIALGPTATILAYDLHQMGYQAIDLGHLDVEYLWMKMKATEKVPIEGRYIGEIRETEVGEVKDENYLKQIVSIIK